MKQGEEIYQEELSTKTIGFFCQKISTTHYWQLGECNRPEKHLHLQNRELYLSSSCIRHELATVKRLDTRRDL